jgi:hypothetical protein
MRRLLHAAPLTLFALAACSDAKRVPVEVWMEWPPTVLSDRVFHVRITGLAAGDPRTLQARIRVADSTVTIEPSVESEPCATCPLGLAPFDTMVALPGLQAGVYRLDGPTLPAGERSLRLVRFGKIAALPDFIAVPGLATAGGRATALHDPLFGCWRLSPVSLLAFYPLENPPDTSSEGWIAFVRGTIDSLATAPCGLLSGPVFRLAERG